VELKSRPIRHGIDVLLAWSIFLIICHTIQQYSDSTKTLIRLFILFRHLGGSDKPQFKETSNHKSYNQINEDTKTRIHDL